MNTINHAHTSFRSTTIPLSSKKSLMTYLDALKNCNIKSVQNMSVENAYKKLFNDAKNTDTYHSGVMLDKDTFGNPVMRFLGFSKGNDEFIFRQLKKVDAEVRYIKDIPDDGFEHNTIEVFG